MTAELTAERVTKDLHFELQMVIQKRDMETRTTFR